MYVQKSWKYFTKLLENEIGIVCYPTYGGSGIVATELGKALADKGHEVHFISYSQPVRLDVFSENMFYHEVSVSDYPLFEYTPYELTLTSKLVDVAMHEKLRYSACALRYSACFCGFCCKANSSNSRFSCSICNNLAWNRYNQHVGKDESFKPVIEFAILINRMLLQLFRKV